MGTVAYVTASIPICDLATGNFKRYEHGEGYWGSSNPSVSGYALTPQGYGAGNYGTDAVHMTTQSVGTATISTLNCRTMSFSTIQMSATVNVVPRPLTASILGQGCAYAPFGNTWTAYPHDGYAPYTYHWSGVLSGTSSSVSGLPSSSGYLFLEVYDSHGAYAQTQIYIDTTDPGC